ncbi:unnamed protein product [Gordionus sp. m RMFG-2023]
MYKLLSAVSENDDYLVNEILNKRDYMLYINFQDQENFCTPLLLGVRYNYYEICRDLLHMGADPNIPDINGQTCLMIATSNNHISMVKLLLEYKVNGKNLVLPLYIASMMGRIDITRILLKHGANPNSTRDNRNFELIDTPLGIAISNGQIEIVKILLNSGADLTFLPLLNSVKKSYIFTPLDSDESSDNTSQTLSIKTLWLDSKHIISMQNYCHLALSKYKKSSYFRCTGRATKDDILISVDDRAKRREILEILLACGAKPYLLNAKEQTAVANKTPPLPRQSSKCYRNRSGQENFLYSRNFDDTVNFVHVLECITLDDNIEARQNNQVNDAGAESEIQQTCDVDNLAYLQKLTGL